jgi:hypothetical protein
MTLHDILTFINNKEQEGNPVPNEVFLKLLKFFEIIK